MSAKINFFINRTTISAPIGHGVCGPVRSPFTLCIRWKACMFKRMMEGHICRDRLRVHLESVYPLMKFENDF